MLLIMNCSISMIFLFLKHPMTLGMALLLQTTLISLITGSITLNFWFSYILFLIMVGGMLVLFIYMTSIASNEPFSYSNKLFMLIGPMMLISMILLMLWDSFIMNIFNNIQETSHLSENINFMSKYFNIPSMTIILFMIIYLLITLVAVVKITKIEYGPLRQYN
uniref:NADH-ubiquinone oxidoreductase chain 6 n=1 Tax=Staphylinidae sp. BMNH 1274697 TaxID=1796595 RepID=A0A126TG28_9COLE|nr:NADH dehydrogenase subunit 6 [Staphylinidae sp. BMNH 1274697]